MGMTLIRTLGVAVVAVVPGALVLLLAYLLARTIVGHMQRAEGAWAARLKYAVAQVRLQELERQVRRFW